MLSAEFRVVRVKPERLRGTIEIWRGGERVAVSDRERTIVDALVDPGWVGGVRHLAEILVTYRRSPEFDVPKLIARLAEVDSGAAYKRIGYLAEALWPGASSIVEVALAHRPQGVIRLDPAVRSRGRMNKRWGLWVNAAISSEPGADDS